MYFEQEIPSVFDGDLENGKEVLAWVVDLLTGAEIEEVSRKERLSISRVSIVQWEDV